MSLSKYVTAAFAVTVVTAVSSTVACTIQNSSSCYESRWGYADHAFDRYGLESLSTTPHGVAYDPSGLPISGALIDRLVGEVEACTGSINRGAFAVKIANDWVPSCDGSQQLLPVEAGSTGCFAKGLMPTEQCPCRWRAGIECPGTIVTTPSMYLFKDALTRFVTGSLDPWSDPRLVKCVTPTTGPLSLGT